MSLQKKQARNNSVINNEQIVAITDKLLDYNSISKKQHERGLFKCKLIPIKKR